MSTWTLIFVLFAADAPPRALSLDWVLDHRNHAPLQVASCRWLPDDTLLVLGPGRSQGGGALERLDPATLERRPWDVAEKVIESWKAIPGAQPPARLGFPQAIAPAGGHLLYDQGGDLFVVNLDPPSVLRLTNTEAREEVPRFSPDGAWLAYVRENDLYIAEVRSGRERRLTRDGSATILNGKHSWVYWEEIMDRRDEAYWWSPDSSAILYLRSDEAPVEEFPLLDTAPPYPSVRHQRYPKAGTRNPSVRAGIVDVSTGRAAWVDLGEPSPEYLARAAWTTDGRAAIVTLDRAQDRLEMRLVDRGGGAGRTVLTETSPTWINLHDDLKFLSPGDRFLWVSEADGFRRLYLRSTREEPAVPLSPPGSILQGGQGGMSRSAVVHVDAVAGQVYFVAAPPASLGSQLYRAAFDGSRCDRLSEGDGTHRITVSPRGAYYLDAFSRSGTPPRLTLHRVDGTLLSVLTPASTSWLASLHLAAPELLQVPAPDGTLLRARLYRPADADRPPVRKRPVVLSVYGGPSSPTVRDSWEGFDYFWANLLLQRGFCVFEIDPRSAADSGKAGEDAVFRRFYGDVELGDILAGVGYLKGLPFVDAERIGIWGWSGGGSTTAYAMTHSRAFRAGIAVAGVTDWRYYDTVYTERYLRRPEDNADGYRSSSVVNSAGGLHGRLLLVHGTADDNVHAQNALAFVDALIAAGKQFELMLYPGRDHGIGDPAARRHLFTMMLEFWERALKGSVAGSETEREF